MESLPLPELCGQLVMGGFDGPSMPSSLAQALAAGQRGGVILFRRNLGELAEVAELCQEIAGAAPSHLPAIMIGIDQEGGRVARLGPPFPSLPPMRQLGRIDDDDLTHRAGQCVGRELRRLGFGVNFAPVLDVDSNPANPVIGDRSFGADPETVTRHGLAFARGLVDAGVAACGKHFPGHGDTAVDSHLELPYVDGDRPRLDRVELPPFRAACAAEIPSIMSAHVVHRGLDPDQPATLSPVVGRLLREELGFGGVLFSDDLEMGAIAARGRVEQAAVAAVRAGCDVLLVCRDLELQERVLEALVRAAEQDEAFAVRCRQAAARAFELRRRFAPRLEDGSGTDAPAGAEDLLAEIEAAWAAVEDADGC